MSQASGTLIKMNANNNETDDREATNEPTLHMEVFEDKEYEIEEVNFWNFVAKNKGAKPSVIRTCVYKCPESSYVFKKCTVIKPKTEKTKILSPNEEVIAKKDSELYNREWRAGGSESAVRGESKPEKNQKTAIKSSVPADCVQQKPEPAKIPRPEMTPTPKVNKIKSLKSTVPTTNQTKPNDLTETNAKASPIAQRPLPVLPTKLNPLVDSTKAHNYKMEDLILIDEDDDIIGYNEDEDDIQNEIVSVENGKSNQFDEEEVEDEEDAEDEDDLDDTDDEDEQMELNSRDHDYEDDIESCHSNEQKNEAVKNTRQPKVVVETVEDEPRKKKINVKQKQTKLVTCQLENKKSQSSDMKKNEPTGVIRKERSLISSTTCTLSENETNASSSSPSNLADKTAPNLTSNCVSNASVISTSSAPTHANIARNETSAFTEITPSKTDKSVIKNVISVAPTTSTLSSFVDNIINATTVLDSAIDSTSKFANSSVCANNISSSSNADTTLPTTNTKSTKTNSK